MAKPVKIRARMQGDVTVVKALMSHPMETGNRKDKQGQPVPEHVIKEIACKHNGKTVLKGNWGASVSKNPYLSFQFKGGKPGDTVTITWVDNKGESGSGEVKIKSAK